MRADDGGDVLDDEDEDAREVDEVDTCRWGRDLPGVLWCSPLASLHTLSLRLAALFRCQLLLCSLIHRQSRGFLSFHSDVRVLDAVPRVQLLIVCVVAVWVCSILSACRMQCGVWKRTVVW